MPGEKESSRNLLENLEKGWDDSEQDLEPSQVPSDPASAPSLDELDARWGDNLFDDEDDKPDEPEEPEPELPDEKLDPVAYAAAQKAREERAVIRREKKKLKLEAKRAKKKARLEAVAAQKKKKQKSARGKKREKPQPEPRDVRREMQRERSREAAREAAREPAPSDDSDDSDDVDDVPAGLPSPKTQALKSKRLVTEGASGPPWRLIAIGVGVVLAAAAAFAALWR